MNSIHLQLCRSLGSDDVDLVYRKSSEHTLESPPDLELFLITLDRWVAQWAWYLSGRAHKLKAHSFSDYTARGAQSKLNFLLVI